MWSWHRGVGHLEKREGSAEIFSLRNSGTVTGLAFLDLRVCVCVSACACEVGSGAANNLWLLCLQFIHC